MAETAWDIRIADDMSGDAIYGGVLGIHRGDQSIQTWSPMVSPGLWRSFIAICRHGTTAEVASVGLSIWGTWWTNEVANRGITDTVRSNVKAWVEIPKT